MGRLGGMIVRSARQLMRATTNRLFTRPTACTARLLRDTRAVTSLEFALVALPYFAMVLGTFAVGGWYFIAAAVDTAVYYTGRQIQTGSLPGSGALNGKSPATLINTVICPNMTVFTPCSTSTMSVNMAVVGDFTKLLTPHQFIVSAGPPKVTGTFWTLNTINSTSLCTPETGAIVYLQVQYKMPILNAGITTFGGTPLTSGTTVQVEQYPNAAQANCTPLT